MSLDGGLFEEAESKTYSMKSSNTSNKKEYDDNNNNNIKNNSNKKEKEGNQKKNNIKSPEINIESSNEVQPKAPCPINLPYL